MPGKFFLLLPVFLLCLTQVMFSQANFASPRNLYFERIGVRANLYNGIIYERFPEYINTGHPFFLSDKMEKGSVFYDGMLYRGVLLQLDEIKDELLTPDPADRYIIQLIRQKVRRFTIDTATFLNVTNGLSPGYYQLLHDGKTQLLKKEIKSISRAIINHNETVRNVETKTTYYWKQHNRYHAFRQKKTLLKLIGSNRKPVKTALHRAGLNNRSPTDAYLTQAIIFYETQAE